jgi:4-carboxymuconolactone decarboxylase
VRSETKEERALEKDERYERGWRKLQELNPAAADRLLESLADIAPDLARYAVEFGFGDVISRPGLDLKTREMITIGVLAAAGNADPQLRAHIDGALHVGCTQEEIVEIMIHIALYAGFPAALNGMAAAKEVFSQRAGNASP